MKTKVRPNPPPTPTTPPTIEQRRAALVAPSHHDTPPAGNVALIAAELVAARCRWCNDDLEHCHDTLVVHAIGETHCMGARCSTPPELHHLVVSCDDFGCTCAQTGVGESTSSVA